jgi:glyoxylase-like metal-dependent hydrolase (beta-lactamase superfamily II)
VTKPKPVTGLLASVLGVSSMFLVEHRGVLTMIDTGSPFTSLRRIIRGIRRTGHEPGDVRQIVLTHCHGDHTGRAKALQEATGAIVVAGALDAEVIEGHAPYPPSSGPVTRLLFERTWGDFPRLSVHRRIGEEQEELEGGLVVIPTPGHTLGHVSVVAPDLDALFVGDTVWRLGPVTPSWEPFTQDPERNQESIRRLAEVPVAKVYPGHGTPFAGDHITRLAGRG